MIQRVQSLWLLVVAIAAFATYTLTLYVGKLADGALKVFQLADDFLLVIIIITLGILAIINLFLFKNRKLQFVLGRLNIILNFILLGLFVYWSLNVSGESEISEKGIGMVIPIVSIVLLVLANKAIKKDEDLVKSVDRLR